MADGGMFTGHATPTWALIEWRNLAHAFLDKNGDRGDAPVWRLIAACYNAEIARRITHES